MSEAKEAALREALNSPMTGDERLRLSLILAEGGGEWEPDPDDAEATLDALDASRAREKALVEALRPFARYAELQHFNARQRRVLMGIRSSEGTAEITSVHFLAVMRALAPYSTPSPDMPSDCHPQGE